MAKINEKQTTNKVEEKVTNSVTQEQTVPLSQVEAMMKRLEELETQQKELIKGKENMFEKAKKRYEGPRNYSYKLWGGVPVLSYVSKRKDNTKDLMFKNQYGEMVSNHLLELKLANGKTVDVDVNEFGRSFTSSEKQPAKVISDGSKTIGYEFDTKDHGNFTVSPQVIN